MTLRFLTRHIHKVCITLNASARVETMKGHSAGGDVRSDTEDSCTSCVTGCLLCGGGSYKMEQAEGYLDMKTLFSAPYTKKL